MAAGDGGGGVTRLRHGPRRWPSTRTRPAPSLSGALPSPRPPPAPPPPTTTAFHSHTHTLGRSRRRLGRGGNYACVGAAHLSCEAGRVWYEVEVMEARGEASVGFAGTNFRGTTVGEDAVSWSIYLGGGQPYHG